MLRLSLFLLLITSFVNAQSTSWSPKLYVFQNGMGFGDYNNEVKVLNELGYGGVSSVKKGGEELAKRIAIYEKAKLKVFSIYLDVSDKAIPEDIVKPMANSGCMIELTIRKAGPKTVEAVRQTTKMAAKNNIKVALYPHAGFSVATMKQGMDLIKKVNHPNLGVIFNLCHFLKSEKVETLEQVIESAGDRLFHVSTSGANLKGKAWGDLIKPLSEGDFPQERLFKALKKINYKGDVGLQCYGIKGDRKTNLKNSIKAWGNLTKQ